jgi:predicted phosphodiesterase
MALWGILSDVHGNRRALEAVLCAMEPHRLEGIYCLGDLVGYCAEPNECVALARTHGFRCILGNHELVTLGELGLERCAPRPAHALARTRQALDGASRSFLEALPRTLTKGDEMLFVHGSVQDTCEYLSNPSRIEANARVLASRYPAARACYFGHTHVATAYEWRDGRVSRSEATDAVTIDEGAIWFVNPGAVDGSRGEEPVARFAILDDESARVTFHRATYDHRATERDARRLGYRMGRASLAWNASRELVGEVADRLARGLR